MFHFYCNHCFRRRKFETSMQLFISRCGHILCNDCVQDNCCICKRPFTAVAVNKEMPRSMAEYFVSPMKQYQDYQKKMKFHYVQERRLVEHLCRSNAEENKRVESEIQGYTKLDDSIVRHIAHERERIRKLREYIAYYNRRFEHANYMTPPITSQPRPRYPSRRSSTENISSNLPNTNIRFTQPIRPNLVLPNSPTISDNNSSSITTEGTTMVNKVSKRQRTPPPLVPFSQHKLLNPQFSFNSLN
ncbi:RING finger protein nenya-like [Calliphora vicina]|uniref:RING finger protein nenya-like n=1 Tax=Calliphora vicina TaxID=7373 RepID=UPI00325B4A30